MQVNQTFKLQQFSFNGKKKEDNENTINRSNGSLSKLALKLGLPIALLLGTNNNLNDGDSFIYESEYKNFYRDVVDNGDGFKFSKPSFCKMPSYDVILDAGHGGATDGATVMSEDSTLIKEKDINRKVTEKVKKILEKDGYSVDILLAKNDSLQAKTRAIMKDFFNPRCFVSIHSNVNEDKTVKGIETLYNSDKDKVLAECFNEVYRDKNFKVRSYQEKTKSVLKDTDSLDKVNVPSTIVEMGFMSNPQDLKYLLSKEGVDESSQIIAKGIENYLKKNDKK